MLAYTGISVNISSFGSRKVGILALHSVKLCKYVDFKLIWCLFKRSAQVAAAGRAPEENITFDPMPLHTFCCYSVMD